MELKNISYNVVNKILDRNVKIYYENHYSIFDLIFKKLDYYIIDDCSDLAKSFYYDLRVTNNYFKYINNFNEMLMDMQVTNLIFFHDKCPSQLKKEDRIILANSLRKTKKIVFMESNHSDWNFDQSTTHFIKYGIPQSKKSKTVKNKDILILNLRNNNQLNKLFQHIKNQYKNTDILTSIQELSLDRVYDILSEYKVVIDVDSAINALCSINCGCISLGLEKFDDNIGSHIKILDFRTINALLDNIFNANNIKQTIDRDIEYIQKNYNFKTFEQQMHDLVLKTKKEPFLK